MKRLLLTAVVAASFAVSTSADEPKLPKSAATPTVALATAKESDGKVSLRVRMVESVPTAETRTVTTYQTISRIVDGKQITEKVPVQTTITVMVMKPIRWREIDLMVGDPGVAVRDLAGKEVPAKKLATLLEKETAILLSTAGAIDPFQLQLAKEGTLVVIAPPPAPAVGVGGVPGAVPMPIALPAPPVDIPVGRVPVAPPPPPKAIPDKK